MNPNHLKLPSRQVNIDCDYFKQLEASILQLGILNPVVCRADNLILDGLLRTLIALKLKLADIPVKIIELTEMQTHDVVFIIRHKNPCEMSSL